MAHVIQSWASHPSHHHTRYFHSIVYLLQVSRDNLLRHFQSSQPHCQQQETPLQRFSHTNLWIFSPTNGTPLPSLQPGLIDHLGFFILSSPQPLIPISIPRNEVTMEGPGLGLQFVNFLFSTVVASVLLSSNPGTSLHSSLSFLSS